MNTKWIATFFKLTCRIFRVGGRVSCLGGLMALLITVVLGQTASASAATVSVTAPTIVGAVPGTTVSVTGASISDSAGNSDQLLVTVSAGVGEVTFTQTSGLTLATGYSSFTHVSTVAFQGYLNNVNAALASLEYTAPSQDTTASVSITATSLADAGSNTIAYDPATGHFYEYVADSDVDWFTAQSDANSMTFDGDQGYLATIPTPAVSSFVEAHLPAHDVWAGGESFDYPSGYNGDGSIQRVWVWADDANQFPSDNNFTSSIWDRTYYGGPLAGEIFTECDNVSSSCNFTNQSAWAGAGDDASSWIESTWNNGEPNNSDAYGWSLNNLGDGEINGEHYLELNTNSGQYWNDLSPYQSTNGANIEGYVVEFGNNWGTASTFPVGQGGSSTSVAVAQAPSAPTGLTIDATASSAGGQVKLSWSVPASDGGSAITGYTVTASPGGATCTTSTTSCTVSGLTNGASYSFTVTAANAVGSSPASVAVTATPSRTPASTTTTTTTTPSTPSVPGTPEVASGHVTVNSVGGLTLSLSCSGGTAACQESGTVEIPGASLKAGGHGMVDAAVFKDVSVAADSTTRTELKLPPAIVRQLQARGVHSVTATVVLKSGSTTTVEAVTARVPTAVAVCPVAGGAISGTTLGLVHLGESIASINGRYLDHSGQDFGFERFCLATRGALRVETPVRPYLAAIDSTKLQGKVVLALTANHHYTLDGIRAGESLAKAEAIRPLGTGIVSGLNTWYVIPGATSTGVLKVQDGRIDEVGIASRRVTSTLSQQLTLFRQATLS